MASYSLAKTMRGLPIGSVQPWTGAITEIPKGWLLCNGAELPAVEYPLLARILRTTYGGVGFSGTFPNYNGTIRIPPTNQKGLADISSDYFYSDEDSNAAPGVRPSPWDDLDSFAAVQEYIGDIGDLGTPSTVFANTDIVFDYQQDPDGVLQNFTVTNGVAAPTTSPILFTGVSSTSNLSGSGATFTVVQNADTTYSLKLITRGQNYQVGEIVTIDGADVGGTSADNSITLTVNSITDGFFEGLITGQSIIEGFGIQTVYIIPRKLSRDHFPAHFHTGEYRTINKNDVSDQPGRGVGVYDNPQIEIALYWFGLNECPPTVPAFTCPIPGFGVITKLDAGNIWVGQTGPGSNEATFNSPFTTGPGRYSIATIRGSKPFRRHIPRYTAEASHGVGKTWFNSSGVKKLRDAAGNINEALRTGPNAGKLNVGDTIPFSDDTSVITAPNYDDGAAGSDGAVSFKQVLFNHAGISYLVDTSTFPGAQQVIEAHDHGGEINIFYDGSGLSIPPVLTAKVSPNVIPDNLENALQITYNIPSPSLAMIHLIRAY
jgi:hypothetical protein